MMFIQLQCQKCEVSTELTGNESSQGNLASQL